MVRPRRFRVRVGYLRHFLGRGGDLVAALHRWVRWELRWVDARLGSVERVCFRGT